MDGILAVVSFGNQYKKGVLNKVLDMLSRPVVNALLVMKNTSLANENYVE